MKITIITITYNSEKTIARTMESVLSQSMLEKSNGEDRVEYLLIDGKSSDTTVAVAESFRSRMEAKGIELRILSEKDQGIYDAMNKGIRQATGDVIGILNSDDWYEKETLQTVADTFRRENCDLMFANIRMHRADGSTFVKKARLRSFQTSRDWKGLSI